MADWEIQKTLGRCWETDTVFEVDTEYYAALVDTAEGMERRDYSIEYWQEHKPEVFCFWKTKMVAEEDKKKKNLFVDDDMLMTFFERLTEETDPEKVSFRFVLMLVLMRKRILKYKSSTVEGDSEKWLLRVTGQDREVEVVDPKLTEDKIEQLTAQMGVILQVDL
jgi:hypothetical protein